MIDTMWTSYYVANLPKWTEATKRLYVSSAYGGRTLSLAIF